jgi:hypothetical protein
MHRNGSEASLLSVRQWTFGLALLVIGILICQTELAAQRPTSSFPQPKRGVSYDTFPHELLGNWKPFPQGRNCGSLKDDRGNPKGTCQYPVDQLEKLMNERAKAWVKFFDEPISPKWGCISGNVTTELGDIYMWNFSANDDAVMQLFEQSNWVRPIYIDGRPHPPATQVSYHGHAIGWMEGETLVVETMNFAFDVDGMDDQSHIATSHMKKQTERYKVKADDPQTMDVEVTVEDPIFFTAPFTWKIEAKKQDVAFTGEWFCDPDVGLHHLYNTSPQRYKDDKLFEFYKD